MNVLTHIRESLANIIHAKMQSFLAILGVLVGTGSVVALISYSSLGTEHALAQFKSLGTNLLAAYIESTPSQSGSSQQSQHLQLSQMPDLQKSSPQIVKIAPYISLYQGLGYHGKSVDGSIIGTVDAFADIAKIKMEQGRFISFLDKSSFYCVIGSDLANMIRSQGHKPIGQQVRIGTSLFTVIGVMQPWEPNVFIFAELNKGAIIPLKTAYILSRYASIDNVLFRLIKKPNIQTAQANIQQKLSQWLPKQQIMFRNPQQIIDVIAKTRKTYAWMLGSIGGISLLVGGIGVMNIMLVSVIERRREIGIRMAIGAQRSDILAMFLIESIFLTLIGGVLGILTGVVVSYLLATISKWQFHLYLLPPLLGFVVSVFVGIVSGIYPAIRASRLDPVQTLYGE